VLEWRQAGLYCPRGDFYIDPWAPVDRAVVTHAHPDHARPGSRSYLTSTDGAALVREVCGGAPIESVEYGRAVAMGGTSVSLHPSGHMLGSAQVRIEDGGEVWVVAGDCQLAPNPTCRPFEPLRCHTFVTGAVFGLPVFRWPEPEAVAAQIHNWWQANREAGKVSLLFAYPLGKAQRVLGMFGASARPIHVHEEVERFNRIYREQGVVLPPAAEGKAGPGALVIAPPSLLGTPWARSFGAASDGMVSGWMRIRGTRRRRSLDRGFVLSDHAGWPDLLRAIDASGAETVWVTEGFRAPLARWLEEHGRRAVAFDVRAEVPEE
jgi:putative mRNA 3-end processing factor